MTDDQNYNNQSSVIDEEELNLLSEILFKHYRKKTKKVPITVKVKEKVKKVRNVPKEKDYDAGPNKYVILTGMSLVAISFVLIFLNIVIFGFFVLALSLFGTYILSKRYRIYKKRTIMVEEEYDDLVEKEVETGEFRDVEIKRTERILSISRININFRVAEINNYKIIVGPEGFNDEIEIKYPIIRDTIKLNEAIEYTNNNLTKVPYILDKDKKSYRVKLESSYGDEVILRGYEKEIMEKFIEIKSLVEDNFDSEVKINYLKLKNLINLFEPSPENNKDNLNEEINNLLMFEEMINSDMGIKIEKELENWLNSWKENNSVLFGVRYSSLVRKMSPAIYDTSNSIQYSAFNFYCPICNSQIANDLKSRNYSIKNDSKYEPAVFSENSRCYYDPDSKYWICPTCGNKTKEPIPIHKVVDELFMPVYDKLLEENKLERIKAHNEAKNKEIQLDNEREKETDNYYYSQVSEVLRLIDEMERIKAEIMGENEAIKSIKEVLNSYEIKQSNVMNIIEEDAERVTAEIINMTNKVLREMDRYKEKEMNNMDMELKRLSRIKKIEDEKRDAIQREILEKAKENIEAVRENTAVVKEGMNNIKEGINEMNKGISNMKEGINEMNKSVKEQTGIIRDSMDSVNATLNAGFKAQGYNLRKRGIVGIGKNIKDAFTETIGNVLGKTQSEIEKDKIKSDR